MWTKCLLLLLLSSSAWGYNLTQDFTNGFYWASLPINITVVDNDPNRKAIIERLAQTAIQEWENKSGLALWDYTSSAKNIIRWSNNFAAETKMDPNSILAVAIRYTDGPYFAKTEIVINGGHPSLYGYTGIIDEPNLQTTLTHELGHTIGLDHSANLLAVMAPTLQSPYNGLQRDDLDGMADAYSQTENRELTHYVSPLAYKGGSSASALSCGTIGTSAATSPSAFFSLGLGMLIGFVRKIFNWFKSRF